MIDPDFLLDQLCDAGVGFFTGVPDSLLSPLTSAIVARFDSKSHIVAANEGCAIALAAGHHLATAGTACVYLQNSGLGNAVNPLTSLMDSEVYGIPVLLIIGWRAEMQGDSQLADEPQHRKQGKITADMLDVLSIPYLVLGPDGIENGPEDGVRSLLKQAQTENRPVALVVRKGSLANLKTPATDVAAVMTREDAIRSITETVGSEIPIVCTTGKASRELWEIRRDSDHDEGQDFLTVGSMGHASQIAAGVALADDSRPVLCLDGDGAAFMHLGGLVTTAAITNYRHIVLNNSVHDSVGGQPTCGVGVALSPIAAACGYGWVRTVSTPDELPGALAE
ncbi:MAG: phosphonopyruvate decarboxylase, partial [Rhodospirillaceae bacterium]|nr:phosphonopyruvate decarboxylase [Rhodospirillaceae bacterium]